MITLASVSFICVALLLLHLMRKILSRRWFIVTTVLVSIVASIATGLYAQFIWYKILIWTVVITLIIAVTFTIAVYSSEWMSDMLKESFKNDHEKK